MNDKLNKRLDECNLSLDNILSLVSCLKKEDVVFCYTSQIEGLGTKNSDIDIYVISDKIKMDKRLINTGENLIEKRIFNGVSLDIEYWSVSTIKEIVSRINSNVPIYNLSVNHLKLILRLVLSDVIHGSKESIELPSFKMMQKLVINYYKVRVLSEYDDAVTLLSDGNYFSSLKCARESLDYLIGAINSVNGYPNLKYKWIPRIYIDNENDADKVDKYKKMIMQSELDESKLKDNIVSILEFIQNNISVIL